VFLYSIFLFLFYRRRFAPSVFSRQAETEIFNLGTSVHIFDNLIISCKVFQVALPMVSYKKYPNYAAIKL